MNTIDGKWTFACLNRQQWCYMPYDTKELAIEAAKSFLCVGCLVGQLTRRTDFKLQYSITFQERILFPFTGWANGSQAMPEVIEDVEEIVLDEPVETAQLNIFNFDW